MRNQTRQLAEHKRKVTPLKVTKFVGETKMEKENKKLLRIIKGDN